MKLLLGLLLVFCTQITAQDFDSKNWWETWYAKGGISGVGSRGDLAQFKADVINDFLKEKNIQTVVEFGCGDGINLGMINYPNYLGLDVSKTIIQKCIQLYKNDAKKSFMLYDPDYFENHWIKGVDLVVCIDVLYHVINEFEYVKVLDDIFSFSSPYIILYTTLTDDGEIHNCPEMKHRNLLDYLSKYKNYTFKIINQKFPEQTKADFIILTKTTISK